TVIARRLLTAHEDGPAFQVAGSRFAGVEVVVVADPRTLVTDVFTRQPNVVAHHVAGSVRGRVAIVHRYVITEDVVGDEPVVLAGPRNTRPVGDRFKDVVGECVVGAPAAPAHAAGGVAVEPVAGNDVVVNTGWC